MTELVLEDPKQWQALASPVRYEIVEFLAKNGVSSIAEIGEGLSRSPDSLYFHVKKLLSVGVVNLSFHRVHNGRKEALYELPADSIKVPYLPDKKENLSAFAKATSAMLRQTERDFKSAMWRRVPIDFGHQRQIHSHRYRVWLTESELAELHRHLNAIQQLAQKRGRSKGSNLFGLTVVLSPLEGVVEHQNLEASAKVRTSTHVR